MFMIGAEPTVVGNFPPPDAPDISLQNMLRLQRDLVTIVRIAAVKEYTRQPIGFFPAGTGVQQYNSAARSLAGTGYAVGNNGGTRSEDARMFATPLYVAGGETFSIDIQAGPGAVTGLSLDATSRIRLRLFLEGYRRRPVA